MRYYNISITDQAGLPVILGGESATFSSHTKTGIMNPGALNIEFDLPVLTAEIPASNGFLKIWGISLGMLNYASILNGMNITIKAGMKPGLPLANQQVTAFPLRNGIIFQGTIYQAFGNWQGTEQSLDLMLTTQLSARPQDNPKLSLPIIFDCPVGGSFQSAIKQALTSAGIVSNVKVSPLLTPAERITFQAFDMQAFAKIILAQSKAIINNESYLGVKTVKTIDGYDCVDVAPGAPIDVYFNDLIGQVAWQDLLVTSMKLVLRSDIKVASTVNMPKSILLNKSKVYGVLKNSIAFSGTGWVQKVRHIGNFRQQDANSWVTVIESIMQTI